MVDLRCKQLSFLHSYVQVAQKPVGTAIGKYVVHYDNGRQNEIPLSIGENIGPLFGPNEQDGLCDVGWQGDNPASRARGEHIRLFKTTWLNPYPEALLTAIDFISNQNEIAPFLVAITAH